MVVFLDTNFIVGLFVDNDTWHDDAKIMINMKKKRCISPN